MSSEVRSQPGTYDAGGSWWGEPVKTAIPPWPGQYKLKAGDKARLTAADVVGPDGVVYPNWKHVGIEGGIPKVETVVELAALGAKPEADISALLVKAIDVAAEKGGGAVSIGEGTYHLNQPVVIRRSGVVIRGAGKDKTRLVFRHGLGDLSAKFPGGWPDPAVFFFRGADLEEVRLLAKDGKRGDTTLTLKETGDLKVGDAFALRAPVTKRWQALTGDKSTGQWGTRTCMYQIRAIRGNAIDIGEGLRIDYPVEDQSEIRRVKPIRRSGLEGFTIVHACRMPFATVSSQWAWECWVRGVDGIDSGLGGAHLQAAKRCEVRDCEFTGFDAKIHRANANWWGYGGFTQSQDCLMENTVWRRFRHGPCVQFGAQGNVIRNSTFEGSDAQWHAGWATENLYENCRIGPSGPYGSYGFGMYATDSSDTTHGPNGPRNVVYNCDVDSSKDGVYARGATEGWIFLHNRFVVGQGGGIYADSGFFDAIFGNNTFVLRDGSKPMLYVRTPDCVGWEVTGNAVYGGNGAIAEGAVKPSVERGNKALPALKQGEALPERPKADPPSIYEWQRERR
jgi:hypothetical protein